EPPADRHADAARGAVVPVERLARVAQLDDVVPLARQLARDGARVALQAAAFGREVGRRDEDVHARASAAMACTFSSRSSTRSQAYVAATRPRISAGEPKRAGSPHAAISRSARSAAS